MATRIWLQMILCLLVTMIAAACCCCAVPVSDLYNPFKIIEPSDLIGTWRAEYNHRYEGIQVTGVETLTLRADGMYQQVYNDGKGYVYTSPWNRWHLDGRVLHLEGGRFYPLGIEHAEKLANGRLFYYSDDDGTGRPLVLDSTTGIILHAWPRSERERGVILKYPPVSEVIIVEFHRVATPVPTPTAIP